MKEGTPIGGIRPWDILPSLEANASVSTLYLVMDVKADRNHDDLDFAWPGRAEKPDMELAGEIAQRHHALRD